MSHPQLEVTFILRLTPEKQIPLTEAEARALYYRLQNIFGATPLARPGPIMAQGGWMTGAGSAP